MNKKKSFSIRLKIIGIIALSILTLSVLIYVVSVNILLESYKNIEQAQAIQNVERVNDAIENNATELTVKLTDWAYWDDTYEFMVDHNQDYKDSNLENIALFNLNINSMVFVNPENEVVFKKAIDLESFEEVSSEDVATHILSNKKLTAHTDDSSFVQGIVMLPDSPVIISSRPIFSTNRTGPIHGTLVFTKPVDDKMIEALGKLTHLSVNLYDFNSAQLPDDVLIAKSNLSKGNTYFTNTLSDDSIFAYHIIDDVYGEPALIIKIDTKRDVYNQGLQTLYSFVMIASGFILLFGILILVLIEILFISRFSKLSKEVEQLGEAEGSKKRLAEGKKDEIGILGISINKMLDALSVSREMEAKLGGQASIAKEKLKERLKELEKVNKLMVDRELRMVELKKENEELKTKVSKII